MAIDCSRSTDAAPDADRFEWQLTPSNSRPLAALRSTAWLLLVGIAALVIAIAGAIVVTAIAAIGGQSLSTPIAIGASLIVVAVGLGPALSWLAGRKHGLTLLRLRLPEPTDPTRSIVEHANTTALGALAALGAGGYLAALAALDRTGLWLFGLAVVATYVGCWCCRWLLPTAGMLDLERNRLVVAAWPDAGRSADRSWHGAMETTRELALADVTSARRVRFGDTTIVWLRTGEWPPTIAAVPSPVADRLAVRWS